MPLIVVLDLAATASALVASYLWFRASQNRLRRISRLEEIDAADLNRMIVQINRTQVLNARAALATAASAAIVALRFGIDVVR